MDEHSGRMRTRIVPTTVTEKDIDENGQVCHIFQFSQFYKTLQEITVDDSAASSNKMISAPTMNAMCGFCEVGHVLDFW